MRDQAWATRMNASSRYISQTHASEGPVNGMRFGREAEWAIPLDSKARQLLPSHHLCKRSPPGPRAKTSSRVLPPPHAAGGPASGTARPTAGYDGSRPSGEPSEAKGVHLWPSHHFSKRSPRGPRARTPIALLPQLETEIEPAMGTSPSTAPGETAPPSDSNSLNAAPSQVQCRRAPAAPTANTPTRPGAP